jgi:RNA polymerase sigma-70 factor (ECF subfamily)
MSGQSISLRNAESFAKLYERTHVILFRFIYGLHGGPPQEVEDLTAETFSRAWRARHRFSGNESAAIGWLLKIARNLVIDAHRRARVRPMNQSIEAAGEVYELPSKGEKPEDVVASTESFQTLWSQIGSLPEVDREIIVLRYILGWPVKDIAIHLDMLDNTVSVKIRRILKRIRDDWPEE